MWLDDAVNCDGVACVYLRSLVRLSLRQVFNNGAMCEWRAYPAYVDVSLKLCLLRYATSGVVLFLKWSRLTTTDWQVWICVQMCDKITEHRFKNGMLFILSLIVKFMESNPRTGCVCVKFHVWWGTVLLIGRGWSFTNWEGLMFYYSGVKFH